MPFFFKPPLSLGRASGDHDAAAPKPLRLHAALLLIGALAALPAALAAPTLSARVGDLPQVIESSGIGPSTLVGNVFETERSTSGGLAVASLLATGQARIGSLSSSSFARASVNSARGGVFSTASNVYWKDTLTVQAPASNPALNGQAGVFLATLLLDGVLATVGGNNARTSLGIGFLGPAAARVDVTAVPGANWTERSFSFESGAPAGSGVERVFPSPFFPELIQPLSFAGAVLQFEVPFVFGQSFDFGVGMITTARIETNGLRTDLIANADFANTLNWGGVSEVFALTPSGRVAVAGYSLGSASGVDLTSPVPELPAWLMLGVGLLGWVARQRAVRPSGLAVA